MKTDQFVRTIEIKDRSGRVVGTKEVVTYQGLLSKAHDEGLAKIRTTLVQIPTDDNGRTAIAKVEVETSKGTFEALGDATPDNVNSIIIPHLIRMAETRAKARALRDAVNIGVVSFEELDGEVPQPESFGAVSGAPSSRAPRSGRNGPPAPKASQDAPRGAGRPNGAPTMSEAQRRYLFRILAGQGIEGEAAHDYLKEVLEVPSLASVSKEEATALIDRLLNGEFQEASGHGTVQR